MLLLVSPVALWMVSGLAMKRPVNPALRPERSIERALQVPPAVSALLKHACYDCHSSETHWPWYAALPLVGRKLRSDVTRGRAMFNFSEWSEGPGRDPWTSAGILLAACAAVEQHVMPKPPYPLLHPSARLGGPEIETLCGWMRAEALRLAGAARVRASATN